MTYPVGSSSPKVFPQEIFKKHYRLFLEVMQKDCQPRQSVAWSRRCLANKRYVYIWADGVYFNIRSDDARQCILVIIGVTEHGRKEFIAIEDGYRESEQSWSELLLRIKA